MYAFLYIGSYFCLSEVPWAHKCVYLSNFAQLNEANFIIVYVKVACHICLLDKVG